jgi:hypothetical protein
MGTMPRLRIADLLANAPTDPEAHLDPARVERYALMLDDLPPVVVFDSPEGPLLADGYHRLAAARRLGLETLEAEVRAGSRHEVLRYAAAVGGAQRGISPEEAASQGRLAHPALCQGPPTIGALSVRTSEKKPATSLGGVGASCPPLGADRGRSGSLSPREGPTHPDHAAEGLLVPLPIPTHIP